MSSKVIPTTSPFVSVKKVVLEFEAASASFVALRVKPDRRRQSQVDMPAALERRVTRQRSYAKEPVTNPTMALKP